MSVETPDEAVEAVEAVEDDPFAGLPEGYDPAIDGPYVAPVAPVEPVFRWRRPRSWQDVCDMMADYCMSDDPDAATPLFDGPLDEESETIRAELVAFNRAGFLTTHSQPGCNDVFISTLTGQEELWVQRAQLSLLVPFRYYAPLREALTASDLLMVSAKWSDVRDWGVPITTVNGTPVTWFGVLDASDLVLWEEALSPAAYRHVSHAFRVDIVDVVWGREAFLWDTLREIIPTVTNEPFPLDA